MDALAQIIKVAECQDTHIGTFIARDICRSVMNKLSTAEKMEKNAGVKDIFRSLIAKIRGANMASSPKKAMNAFQTKIAPNNQRKAMELYEEYMKNVKPTLPKVTPQIARDAAVKRQTMLDSIKRPAAQRALYTPGVRASTPTSSNMKYFDRGGFTRQKANMIPNGGYNV